MTAICPIPLASYPSGPRLRVKGRTTHPLADFRIIAPPFINWGPLKILSLCFSVGYSALRAMGKWGRPQAMMLYNPYLGYTVPALLMSRLFKIPLVGVVADMNSLGPWTLRSAPRQAEIRVQRWLIRRFDGLMPFSIHTAHELAFIKPVMRLDPGVNADDFAALEPVSSTRCERVLLFCGTLSAENGLKLLLDAFARIKDQAVGLWISGRGDMQAQVESLAAQDPRVRFLGFIEHAELLKIMQHSLLLVNPRPPSLPQHRFNFPSKILEYLASGRPVISLASADIALEYGKYLILSSQETPEALASVIDESLRRDPQELDELGRKGRDYVLQEKNWATLSRNVASVPGEDSRQACSVKHANTDQRDQSFRGRRKSGLGPGSRPRDPADHEGLDIPDPDA